MAGFAVSVLVGHIFLWLLVEKFLWPYTARQHGFEVRPTSLSGVVGMVERLLYTSALVVGAKEWIGVWLAIKVVARWQTSEDAKKMPGSDNIWLVGTGLSVLFGFIGAWVALGKLPI